MDNTLKRLRDIKAPACVTILLNTHRNSPESKKDEIVLKNLITEAENRLHLEWEGDAPAIVARLNELASTIDPRYNLESLALFVNHDTAEFVRLPVRVENRVVIDHSFATRDLIRMLHREVNYYILVLSREKARLIEAAGDKKIWEVHTGFPMENAYTVDGEGKLYNRESGLVLDFFNHVKNQLDDVLEDKNLPVFICTEQSNYGDYLRIGGAGENIAGHIDGSKDSEDVDQVVADAWPSVEKWQQKKNGQLLTELKEKAGAGDFETDLSEIWKAIMEGKGKTLYVKEGYLQPAKVENATITPSAGEEADVDDIIDEMIEKNEELGGETVFIPGDELKEYNDLVLLKRFG